MSLLIDLQGHGYNLFKLCWWTSGREMPVRIPGADDGGELRRCKSCNGLEGAFRFRDASSFALRAPTLAVTWASKVCRGVRERVLFVVDAVCETR